MLPTYREGSVREPADPKMIVADGYDRIGGRYSEQASRGRAQDRARYQSALIQRLPAGAEVLDLGCGAGIPATLELAQHFAMTGVDISPRQVERARQNVPKAGFIHADMVQLDLPPHSYDGVTAFFSLIHVPRREQLRLLQSIATWLRPGGLFVASMSAKSKEFVVVEDWLGAPMYWSGYDSQTNRRVIEEAGLDIISAQGATYGADGVPGRFLWIVAEKPSESNVQN